ncbi:MAG: pimeloyl-ACP methyl ester carboxylesterase [Myxococcota bacterium]|jgi:pimeloyl-ACP methyl ester carboxylesterase
MQTRTFQTTANGWSLELKQSTPARPPPPGQPPVLIIPGYGMNDFIFRFHPTGTSLIGHLVEGGLEVWSANLRGQGSSRPTQRAAPPYGLAELALEDLPEAIRFILEQTGAERIDLIGCSLGATVAYGYLAHHPDAPVRAMVSMGGPLRWPTVHPLLQIAFRSERLAGALPIRGTRRLARLALPIARRIPPLLLIYATPWRIDLSQADALVQTVEDPTRQLNAELARWFRTRDLILCGVDVTAALGATSRPMLCVFGVHDGIVPADAALAVRDAMPEGDVEVLAVGDAKRRYAHADLFISEGVQEDVFEPMLRWLYPR